MSGPARLELCLGRPGRHRGNLCVPWSHDDSAYGELRVPVIVVHGPEPGPTALLTAGVHGDEPEGQVALLTLARTLEPARLRGRVIIVPAANPPAVRAGRRTSPVDGGNLARLFPGDPGGGLTARIADGINRLLLHEADWVLDLHGGGRSLEYLPCAWGRLPAGRALATRVLDALTAFGAPLTAVVRSQTGGTLVSTALQAGTVAFATEIGGAGALTPEAVAIASRGIARILAHAQILKGALPSPGPTRLLEVRPEHFLRSAGRGLFEPAFCLGDTVEQGALAGHLHDLERLAGAPEPVTWPASGFVLCRRVPALVEPGDTLAHLAGDSHRGSLMP